MKFLKKVLLSFMASIILFSSGFFWSFIPCKVIPGIPGAQSFWSYCGLGLTSYPTYTNSTLLYLGWTESIFVIYVTFITLLFIIFLILFSKIFKAK